MTPFGPIRQLGFVVRDIHDAMKHWTTHLGVGPFFHVAEQPFTAFTFRGRPASPAFSVALAQSGGVQIELIQQLNDQPSAFNEFATEHGEGLQHVAYWTTNFDAAYAAAVDGGMSVLQEGISGSGAPDERFAYFTHDGPVGTVLELSETSGRKGELFAAVAAAADGWDGSDPVRDMNAWVRP